MFLCHCIFAFMKRQVSKHQSTSTNSNELMSLSQLVTNLKQLASKKKTIFLKFEEFKNKLGSIVLERFEMIYNLAKYQDGLKKSGLTVLFFF